MSQIFYPFRSIGQITNQLPFEITIQQKHYSITTSVGKCFQVYNGQNLRLESVSPLHPSEILGFTRFGRNTFVVCSKSLYIWHQNRLIETINDFDGTITHLQNFGKFLLTATSNSTITLSSFKNDKFKKIVEFTLGYRITAILHPRKYKNKILIANENGELELWNIRTKKLVYKFKGWSSEVSCLVQSTEDDIVGIGLVDGRIFLHNLKFDRTVRQFSQEEGKVTSLSFRTDGVDMIASGTINGRVILWDLNENKLFKILKRAHKGPISKVEFLRGKPIMITSGSDNALKVWVFDQLDGTSRLLRERRGHSNFPHKIKYYKNSQVILSGGQDHSLRMFSTILDRQSKEISQGQIEKKAKLLDKTEDMLKLPVITDFDANSTREMNWSNVITCHRGSPYARIWGTENAIIDKKQLKSQDGSIITAVSLSKCGNFAIIGTQSGKLEKFNIQSALNRGEFGEKSPKSRHRKQITGIFTDILNSKTVSVSHDGKIKIWDFDKLTLLKEIDTKSKILKLTNHFESNLFAIVTSALKINVYDLDTLKMVRQFSGHKNAITDLVFSNDSHWILTSSLDSTIKIFDLPSSKMIDWIKFEKPVVSMAFSPNGDFLATTHSESLGIYLWANKKYFSSILVSKPPKKPLLIELPNMSSETDSNVNEEENENKDQDEKDFEKKKDKPQNRKKNNLKIVGREWKQKYIKLDDIKIINNNDNNKQSMEKIKDGLMEEINQENNKELVAEQLSEELITLSKVPRKNWKNLQKLDIIKERNKPKDAPKKPKLAPFFLGTIRNEGKDVFNLDPVVQNDDEKETNTSKVSNTFSKSIDFNDLESELVKVIKKCENDENKDEIDYLQVVKYLSKQKTSDIDLEFRSLNVFKNYDELKLVLRFFKSELSNNRNFELIQSYLDLFLRIYIDQIIEDQELLGLIKEIRELQKIRWQRLSNLFQKNFCRISFFANFK
ncbi:wd repeat-containing protein [Anaeramoeba flamelloides]|uniref:Wd repeat-containing protein n=1 Tax=Anaeramoeba flamelloides TaxID=1746091 RepID=A0ABQ8XM15_9EUKA|nr:wd repeat-containing protein [Anaeramoeba flamelloides]